LKRRNRLIRPDYGTTGNCMYRSSPVGPAGSRCWHL